MIKLKDDDFKAHHDLGILLIEKQRYPEAITQFQKTLSIKPNYFLSHGALGLVYSRQGRTKEAIEQFQTVLQLDPNNQAAKNMLKQLTSKGW